MRKDPKDDRDRHTEGRARPRQAADVRIHPGVVVTSIRTLDDADNLRPAALEELLGMFGREAVRSAELSTGSGH